ncbi:decorin-like [Bradysia coprophila]|uniref:decorin-like n=1 Tax=Bradysia coprophila TaxID=38358 RepID=UPI00187D8745|nr:decorin-like [Bradysia coprophila]
MSFQTSVVITLVCLFQMSGTVFSNDRINLRCYYGYEEDLYACTLYNLNITTNVEVDFFNGSHLPGLSNDDVKMMIFNNGTMIYLPAGMGILFTNLLVIKVGDIFKPLPFKNLQRSSFNTLKKLTYLAIYTHNTDINIELDAFWDLKNLTLFYVNGRSNSSLVLQENTFRENKRIRYVEIAETYIEVLPRSLFRHNLLLDTVLLINCSIKTIDENIFETNTKLVNVELSDNKIEHLPTNLFSNKPELRHIFIDGNKLQTIEVDFTKLRRIEVVFLLNNTCTDAEYWSVTNYNYDVPFGNIYEFQNAIRANCSAHYRVPMGRWHGLV